MCVLSERGFRNPRPSQHPTDTRVRLKSVCMMLSCLSCVAVCSPARLSRVLEHWCRWGKVYGCACRKVYGCACRKVYACPACLRASAASQYNTRHKHTHAEVIWVKHAMSEMESQMHTGSSMRYSAVHAESCVFHVCVCEVVCVCVCLSLSPPPPYPPRPTGNCLDMLAMRRYYLCVSMYIHIYAYIYMCACTCEWVWTYINIHIITNTHVHMLVHLYTLVLMCIYMYVCTCTCIDIYMCVYVYTYMYREKERERERER